MLARCIDKETSGDDDGRGTDSALRLGPRARVVIGLRCRHRLALARAGMNIFGVHLDRKSTLPNAERVVSDIKGLGRQAHFYNINAADEEKRAEVSGDMERILRERNELGHLRVLLHSLAFGTLKLFVTDPIKEAVSKSQMDMTLDVMAHSL